MKKFALIGGAGYIAPRHVQAIQHTGNDLGAILDPYDGVGYIDKYFPKASYFSEAERFDRHLYRHKKEYDYVSICSPNYLHDAHIRLALRNECDVICEKPLVLNTRHLDSLQELENETGKSINTILQLRYHDAIINLREKYKNTKQIHKVTLDYITPRGKWYDYSWKGNLDKSGGVTCNIGIHFFDMLIWIFGDVISFDAINTATSSKGKVYLEHAEVDYNLSINQEELPWDEWKPYRNITIDNNPLEFSEGFTELHNRSYEQILNGNGFGIKDVYPSIALVDKLKRI
jgi:UDP-N-acetyl-2-amino-2-deoxyglucuronate dehydrogenase